MKALSSPAPPAALGVRERILSRARIEFFERGYSGLTMDELASDLGMSKKTLYVHFPSKDAIITTLIDTIASNVRREADAMLGNENLNFAEKLHGFIERLVGQLTAVNPRSLRDLQRMAPHLHERVEDVRAKNIPYVFGRFIAEGIEAGHVRPDVSPAFAIEFFLQAMQGLMHPVTLERLGLRPNEVVPRAIALFFGGLLSPLGRKHYEKVFPQ
jgi:AcrR family transcriptional regulator